MPQLDVNPDATSPEFEALLDFLKQSHHFDFTGYKRSTLMRQVHKRMQRLRLLSWCDYRSYLQKHSLEFVDLFNTIEINFTNFFRDAAAWDLIRTQIIPQLIAGKSESEPLRVWSAGCATGEEAYTLAMVLTQALGVEQFHRRVKIIATDVDEAAISQARHATYKASRVANVPAQLLEQYFWRSGSCYTLRGELRHNIFFGRHNLIQDPPLSRIDLLACRNVLIYFQVETQTLVLKRLHKSLNDGGFLFLGKAEIAELHTQLFTSVSQQHRIYTKAPLNDLPSLLNRAHLLQ